LVLRTAKQDKTMVLRHHEAEMCSNLDEIENFVRM
jgi:hypothetical protein